MAQISDFFTPTGYRLGGEVTGRSPVTMLSQPVVRLASRLPPNPPSPRVKRIVFPPGSESAVVTGRVTPANINEYVIRANAGQRMLINVNAEEQRVAISVAGADGTVLQSSMGGFSSFSA